MKPGGGKSKGSRFEREISRALSLWLTKGQRDDCLWRSAMSGGRATLQLRQFIVNMAQSGDLTAISPEAYALAERCYFELKSYGSLQIAEGLLKGTGNLYRFWQGTKQEGYRYNKVPVLIAKQNRFPVILLCPIDCHAFNGHPLIELHDWQTAIYLFDDATKHDDSKPTGSAVSSRIRVDDADLPFVRRARL